jgi:hypothetical protein
LGDIIAFDLTACKGAEALYFETLPDIGPDIQPRGAICDEGTAEGQSRRGKSALHGLRNPTQIR